MLMLVFDSTYPAFSFRAKTYLRGGGAAEACAPLLAVVGLNPGGAGVSSPLPLAGGGGGIAPCLTSELIGGSRSARRRSKALNERIIVQS